MYQWRKLDAEGQESLLAWRRRLQRPWHSPPHFMEGPGQFHLTAACYEHAHVIGLSPERMTVFSESLLHTLAETNCTVHGWRLLPNHYHLLVTVPDLQRVLRALGQLHGRSSFQWNGEENQRGRKVWCAPADRAIRSEAHFWATLNYLHHNPVKHGHVQRWQEWPWSSATDYLHSVGPAQALKTWKAYPILDYGAGWDD